MKPALLTLFPLTLLAMFTMIAGEKLARRVEEKRLPVDEQRLFAFDQNFRTECQRLDSLYLGHLQDLAHLASTEVDRAVVAEAETIAGVRLLEIISELGNGKTLRLESTPRELPTIKLESTRPPFNPDRTLVIPKAWLDTAPPAEWLAVPGSSLTARCLRTDSGVLVVILIDSTAVRAKLDDHLARWLPEATGPLADERIAIETPEGQPLFTLGKKTSAPASATLPIHSLFGTWRVRAWDGVEVTRFHDPATLAVATSLAILLVAGGLLLHREQRRSLRLAAERVSFVNRVSHELGSPLTNLSLNLDLAMDALPPGSDQTRRRLATVGDEVGRLSRLVANVLTFSRKERSALEIHPVRCQPDAIARRAIDSFRPAFQRRNVTLEHNLTAVEDVLLDPDALEQITGNLLSNIEKYAAAGGWARLETSWQNGELLLTVTDRGPGIPRAERERVFQPFKRVLTGPSEGASGTGLGLAISRDLAQAMGGTLELLESGAGATFQLRLPAPSPLSVVRKESAA